RQMQARHPGVPLAISALFPPARRRELERLGCLVFPDPSAAIRTIGAVAGLGSGPAPGVVETSPATADAGALPLLDAYNEVQAMELLRLAGLPASPCVLAGDADAAVRAAASLGAACVLKVVSPDITHKSDVGGVKLNVQGDDALRSAYADILAAVRQHRPDARIDGVLVAPMAPKGVECIAGVHCDPVFGPVVMFGLGGVFVEVLKDVSFRLAPFGREDALAMIHEIKGYALLQGARGAPPCDIGALAEALAALSRFAHARRADFSSVEINPLLALPEGQGVVALDAVVIRADA
ncbi:acetate--CoA ligase family protein, partial [Achromobacter insolitus]|uniref:acetate--CoA ligase family protein n=1 Tax=Achromobacter insolitus TaxID=217204 RepID=UPI0028AEE55D